MVKKCRKFVFAALFAVFVVFTPAPVPAQEEDGGIKTSTDVELQISTRPEAKLRLTQRFVFPFLTGSGPLTKDNNITAVLSADATPISVNGSGELIWQPAAFFLLSGGGQAGSGWNIPLGEGIGINGQKNNAAVSPGTPAEGTIFGGAFDGLMWSAWGAGTFQFDLGAIFPGDWTHVLFQTRQEFRYSAYTRADPGEPWIFENDDGENQNGWKYRASYVLGYSMPRSPVLNMIGLMAELNKSIYDTAGGELWGENLGKWIFSALFNLSFTPRFSTSLGFQMRTRYNYGEYNIDDEKYFHRSLELRPDLGGRHLIFYRAAAIMNFKIR